MERAWNERDRSYDGLFFLAVKTTGIFCRPSCPSRPKREHVEFFAALRDAISAGYRPCKRCQPELVNGDPPDWIARIIERVNAAPETRLGAADLRDMNTTPERVRRWFQQNYGMTFSNWSRGIRLSRAFTQLRNGARKEDAMLGNGFQSHSGFADALTRTFGESAAPKNGADCIRMTMIETSLGPMIAAANDKGVCFLEFADRRGLETTCTEMRKRFSVAVLPGDNAILKQLREELAQYFAGQRRDFSVPVFIKGTPFQENVWRELQKIPAGETASYEAIAERVGNSRAVRAVARANGTNRICILIPCHRVIAKDGTLSGYGGGVWRKRLLLELEQK
ncbi:MAG: methylated-DNA--[protein]-cysteine S-methyltransferase [Verrucomicrobia bacterium]|nr:methylated-DNA--[protein]-cysteine S-methyltransferase [Verrucomicrobiota bacterium]